MALTREQAALVAAAFVKLAVTGGGMAGPTAVPVAKGGIKPSSGGKKVSTPKGAAFYHLPIGSLIVVHGQAVSTSGHTPGGPSHGPGSAHGIAPGSAKTLAKDAADKLTPHGWIPEAKWLEGQAKWEAIWKANEWKGHGSHHIWAGGHMFSVPSDAKVYAPQGTDPDNHHHVAEAKKIVVFGEPGAGKAAALNPDGTFTEMTLNEHLMQGLKEHGVELPGSDKGNQHLPVKVGDAVHHIPEDWHVYKVGKVENFLYAKDPEGKWHTINSSGVGAAWYGQMNDQMDDKVESGQAALYEHPVSGMPEHQPPPAHPQPAGPIAGTTTIAGQDGNPISVTFEQISEALDALHKSQSTQVKQPLKAIGNPLATMDYHQINKNTLKLYPELKLAPGSKQAHVGQVKTSVLFYLAEILKEQPPSDAHEAAAEEAEDEAQADVHHTYATFSSVITLPKQNLKAATEPLSQEHYEEPAEDSKGGPDPEGVGKPTDYEDFYAYKAAVDKAAADKAEEEPAQVPEEDLKPLVEKLMKEPPPEIADALEPQTVGGVFASQADIQGAITALEAHPTSTAIKQILKGADNKLQNADYWGVIHQFEQQTGKKAKGKAREQFIAALKSYLGEAKAADTQSGTDVTTVLGKMIESLGHQGIPLGGNGSYQEMITKALIIAHVTGVPRYVEPTYTDSPLWEVVQHPSIDLGYYKITPQHTVIWLGTQGSQERPPQEVLAMTMGHFAQKGTALHDEAKLALKELHAQTQKDLKQGWVAESKAAALKQLAEDTVPEPVQFPTGPYKPTTVTSLKAKEEPTTPVIVDGKKVADVPFGSDIYAPAGSTSKSRWVHTPDYKWLMVTNNGVIIPLSAEEDLTHQVLEGGLVLLNSAGDPVEPPKDEQVTAILNLAEPKSVYSGPGFPLSDKLGFAVSQVDHGEFKDLYVTPFGDGSGWQASQLAPSNKDTMYFHVFPKGEVHMWTGSQEAEMNKAGILNILKGVSDWEQGQPAPASSKMQDLLNKVKDLPAPEYPASPPGFENILTQAKTNAASISSPAYVQTNGSGTSWFYSQGAQPGAKADYWTVAPDGSVTHHAAETGLPAVHAPDVVDPEHPDPGTEPGTMPVIINGKIAAKGPPLGSQMFQHKPGTSSASYYSQYVYALTPEGKWLQITKDYAGDVHDYEHIPEKMAKGELEPVTPATPDDIAAVKKLEDYKQIVHAGAVEKAKIKADPHAAIVAGLAQQGIKSYYSKNDVYVYQTEDSSAWHMGTHPGGLDKSKIYYEVKAASFEVVQHGGVDDGTMPLADVFAHVDEHLIKDAVMIGGSVHKYGNYYKPKGKGSYLEIKASKHDKYGNHGNYNSTYKYGSAARATYVWHKQDGTSETITPTAAVKHLETAEDFHAPGEVLDYAPKTVKPKTTSLHATVATAGTVLHTVNEHGVAQSTITIHPDGSAKEVSTATSAPTQYFFSLDEALATGNITDGWATTAVKPGVTPAHYFFFGAKLSLADLSKVETQIEQVFHDKTEIVKILKSLDGFKGSAMAGWGQKVIPANHAGEMWEAQRDAILALIKDLHAIPKADPALAVPVTAGEPKFLKGLPPGITTAHDVFKFNDKGHAAPYEGDPELPDAQMLLYLNATELTAIIKAVSAQYGGGKVVGTHPASLTKQAKADWVKSFMTGDMQKIFYYDSEGGKVSPAHPGAPGNTETHTITWAPWGKGQTPAGDPVEGNWSDYTHVTLPKAEVNNYLIKAGLQHAEFLSPVQRRDWVLAHRGGNQKKVDDLSRFAYNGFAQHENPLTDPPVWTDNIQPANAWDVFLEDKSTAENWTNGAAGAFMDAHQAEMVPFMDQVNDGWTGKLSGQPSYYITQALQLYLDHLAAVELAEKMKPRYHKTTAGMVADQFEHTYFFHEGKDATRNHGLAQLGRMLGFRTPDSFPVTLETGEKGTAVEKIDGKSLAENPLPITSMDQTQINQLSTEHILDWVLDNPHGSAKDFALDSSGSLVGIHKEGAFHWRLGKQPGTGQGFFNDSEGHQHWGWDGGAGLLVQHTDDQGVTRYLLQKRSKEVMNGGTWSTPGGAIDHDRNTGELETPDVAALRETEEEWGKIPHVAILGQDTIHHGEEGKEGHWAYHTVHASVAEQFTPEGGKGEHGAEAAGFKWVTLHEMEKMNLHPGFAETAKQLGAKVDPAKTEWAGRWNLQGRATPSFYSDRLDTQLYDAIAAGQITQEAADKAYVNAIRTARRMAMVSDDRMRAILQDTFGHVKEHPRIQSIIARKNWLEPSFQSLWQQVYEKAGWQLPEVPAERLSHGLHSGFSEPSFFDHIMAGKNAGVPAFFSGTELEDGHFLVWTELAGENRLVNGEAGVRGKSLDAAVAWAEQHEQASSGAVPLGPGASGVAGEKAWYDTVLVAGKAVSRHAHDGMYSGTFTKGKLAEMATLATQLDGYVKAAEAVLADPHTNKTQVMDAFKKLGLGDSPELARHAAQHYLNLIGKIETAKAEHGSFKSGDLPRWHAPKHLTQKAKLNTKVKVVKQKASRTLGKAQKLTNLTEYGKDPTAGEAVLGQDGELHLGEKTYDYPGQAWYITLPTGEVIELNDEEKTNTPLAQRGRVRFRALASDGSVSLERIRDQLKAMGLNLNEAEQHDMEVTYWRMLTHTLADRKDRKDGKLASVWHGLAAGGAEHNAPGAQKAVTTTDPGELHKAINAIADAGLPAEEEVALWHHAWSGWTSEKQIKDWADEQGYLPRMGHFDPKHPEITGGKPHWFRHDADMTHFAKLKMPSHSLGYKQKEGHPAMHIVRTGMLASTEARLRALGIWRPGKSSLEDMNKGSSGTVFTTLNSESTGTDILLHPRVLAQVHTYGFNSDHFGNIEQRHADSYFNLKQAAAFSGSGNETEIKDAISFLDDVEMIKVTDASLRKSLIAELHKAGVTEIRGVPVEKRIVASISPADIAAAHDRLKAEAADGSMLSHPAEHYIAPPSEHVSSSHSIVVTKAEQQAISHDAGEAGSHPALATHELAAPKDAIHSMYRGGGKYPEVGKAAPHEAGAAKAEVAHRVSSVMTSTDDQMLELGKAAGLSAPESWGKNPKARVTSALVKTWATSHNSAIAHALKLRAHELFGVPKPVWKLPELGANTEAEAMKLMEGFGSVLDDFLKAMWSITQQDLEAAGAGHVTLYRIMRFSGGLPGWAAGHQKGDVIDTPESLTLSSWAFDQLLAEAAGTFGPGKGSGAKAVVVKVTVPRELILSYPRSGFGAYNEAEFVLLDSGGQWEIIKI